MACQRKSDRSLEGAGDGEAGERAAAEGASVSGEGELVSVR